MPKYREPNIFDKFNMWIDGAEGSIINTLTAIAPWGAPTPPAYMTYVHAMGVLQFPQWVAITVAMVVEILGLATVSTGIKFWKYNQKNKKASDYRKAPVEVVVAAFIFYLAVIITSNVILDATGYFAPDRTNYAIVAVKAFYTLLTIPAALIISVRQQHRDILDEASIGRQSSIVPPVPMEHGTSRPSPNRDAVFYMLDDVMKKEGRIASYTEVRDTLHIPQASASRLRKEWMEKREVRVDTV